jgi:hypothetical protein
MRLDRTGARHQVCTIWNSPIVARTEMIMMVGIRDAR